MAAEKTVIASGADVGDGVRRRAAPQGQSVPVTAAPETDDKKKYAKKVIGPCFEPVLCPDERAPC